MKKLAAVLLCLALLALPIGFLPDALLSGKLWPYAVDVRDESLGADRDDARARYLEGLGADAAVAAGVRDAWLRAGTRALDAPLALSLPYAESLSFGADASESPAAVFAVSLAPPDVLHLRSAAGEGAAGGLLVDVLQRRGERLARLAAFGPAPVDTRWTPPVGGEYLVRVQGAIGTAGAFALALASRPPLDFPVLTDVPDAVRSPFGAPRDGGRREHHGIDIFAPRGTPVLAAADGIVARVGRSTRGGLHVWQRAEDEEGRRLGALYYAHLDSTEVLAGSRVRRGERLGTVGNTGNARTTPPHLHFGLYRRYLGPVDPAPLVGERRVPASPVTIGHALPPWLAVRPAALNLRGGPGTDTAVVERLARGDLVRVLGLDGGWVRVRARRSGGAALDGFVARAMLGPPDPREHALERARGLRVAPSPEAPRLATLEPGTTVRLLGAFGAHERVETVDGTLGWLPIDTPTAADPVSAM